jgi:hypothetical protein
MQPNPTQPMPNPFLTNAPNKKGRPQLPVQENPFLSVKCNSFSEQKCIPEPVQIQPSFEELFPSLTKSNAKSNSDKSNSEQSPVPKLNFKSAVKGQSANTASQSANPISQSANPISQSANPISQPASQIQNQFLRPMNQFLQPRSHDHANRMRYGYDDSEFNDDDGDNHDAYDSAYTKYYDD